MLKHFTLVICAFLFCSFSISAQSNFWRNANSTDFRAPLKDRVSHPSIFRTVAFDTETFLNFAENASHRLSSDSPTKLMMTIPMPNGENENFTIEKTDLMHPDLAAKFPELKTYVGKGIDDPTASLRISYSPYFGFNGMVLSGQHSTVYIDPLTSDNKHYMAYYRKDVNQTGMGFSCHTDETIGGRPNTLDPDVRVPALGDCNLRRYRLAQSCTGEYAQYHIGQAGGSTGNNAGDKAIVQAAMNVTLTRVNGVYERDLGITLQFIPNNDLIIYLVANSDPWSNEWNTTTAQTIDAQIGVNNYDIGHNFNNTGGGSAGCLDCVCLSISQNGTHKGRGYTGQSAPIGDLFDIDYVAHEMGHQFGGYHTQSNNTCRSGSGATEVEPGSASTIMGYAGICAANVQNASDDYFAYVNIRDIVTSINGGNGSGCAELITSGNGGPTADAGSNYSIPVSTPFKLEGIGTDPDDAGLTYCWEQNDPENPNSSSTPPSTRTVGPMFRSLRPVAEPYRYMPNLNDIINNNSPIWEVLPSVSRNMEFSFIVRDNNSVSGCTASDLMSVTTVAAAGPFLVNSPNTAVIWDAGSTETVTWDVAGTTAAPISCANVDILLSTDGGQTYPVTLATGVPNDGSHDITVPNNPGTNTRVMVVCSDNIFFDISNTDFTIQLTTPDFTMTATPTTAEVCAPTGADFTIDLGSLLSFNSPVTLTTSGVPAGATASFSTNPVTPVGSSVLTINPGTAALGTYTITVNGVGGGQSHSVDLTYTIAPSSLGAVTLISPTDLATNVSNAAPLSWNAVTGTSTYEVEVATDAGFSNIVYSQTGITATNTTATGLAITTTYYWRVRAVNSCNNGAWSSVWSFTTQSIVPCLNYAAGPYTNLQNAPCASACGTPIVLPFEVYANESYLVNNVAAGAEYTFEFCNGYNAGTWAANITVAYYDGTAATTEIYSTSGCTATFTTPTAGDIIIIIWNDPCGGAELAVDNGIPSFMCTGNGTVPDCQTCLTEDFEAGQPTSWYFANAWTFDNGCIGAGTTGCNSGTNNWGYFDDDVLGSGSTGDIGTATTPYLNLANACNVTMTFNYTYREYDDPNQEFVQLRVYDGTQWQYWNGASWGATGSNWLDATSATGTFNETIPAAFYNGAFKVEFIFNDNGGWEYGFGIDDLQISNDCSFLENIPEDATATTYIADREVTTADGWTHYVDDLGNADPCDDMLLLSVKKNGQNIGTVGDGTFVCTLGVDPTASNITNPPALYVSNPNGWWVMNRYWNILPTTEPSADVEVRFYYTEDDFTAVQTVSSSVTTHEDLYFWKINDNLNAWDVNPMNGHNGVPLAAGHAQDGFQQYAEGGASSTTSWMRQLAWAGNTNWNYAQYTVGHFGGGGGGGGGACPGCEGALPVELLEFTAKPVGQSIQLDWITATEFNNLGYEVQRSLDPVEGFREIAWVEGQGTSTQQHAYDLKDVNVVNGVLYYYRLKQVDTNGKIVYSNVVNAKITSNTFDVSLVPNPAKSKVNIIVSSPFSDYAKIDIFNVQGQLVKQLTIAEGNTNQIEVNLDGFSAGIYTIRIENNNQIHVEKLVVYKF